MNLSGRLLKNTFLFLILFELISFIIAKNQSLNSLVFLIIIFTTLVLALIKLEYGLYVLLTELFVGGYGYLFNFDLGGFTISLRLGLFIILLISWLIKLLTDPKKSLPSFLVQIKNYPYKINYLLIFLLLIFGVINSFWHNNLTKVFLDVNAWFYFVLIFVFLTTIKNEKVVQNIITVLVAATTFLAIKTLLVLFLFSHGVTSINDYFYQWLRNTGVGEVTYISGAVFRVFFQSQLYCLIGFLIILTFLALNMNFKNWRSYWPLIAYSYLAGLAILISQSRSFWVGGIAALIFLLVYLILTKLTIKKIVVILLILILGLISQIGLIQVITGDFSGNLVNQRFANLEKEPASLSRLNQLKPLMQAIYQSPILGYGFGKELTYQSSDPRIVKTYPNGIYTTYAFEWGYLDIILKIGLVGLLVYLALIVQLFFKRISNTKSLENSLSVGLSLGLLALCIVNIFSPYLNHPLGIGYLMLISVIKYAN